MILDWWITDDSPNSQNFLPAKLSRYMVFIHSWIIPTIISNAVCWVYLAHLLTSECHLSLTPVLSQLSPQVLLTACLITLGITATLLKNIYWFYTIANHQVLCSLWMPLFKLFYQFLVLLPLKFSPIWGYEYITILTITP